VVPNSIAQVAAAIEEKRVHHHLDRRPSYSIQGRAFAAPRMQSLDRMQAELDNLILQHHEVDSSPRCYRDLRPMRSTWSFQTPPSNRKARLIKGDDVEGLRRRLRHVASSETNRTNAAAQSARSSSIRRLAATSLGFREAEVDDHQGSAVAVAGAGCSVGAGGACKSATGSNADSFKSCLEAARARQFQFEGRKNKDREQNTNRWGSSWWETRRREKDLERQHQHRQQQQKMLQNWI